jgi:IclR family mhp operon transcriptional activator
MADPTRLPVARALAVLEALGAAPVLPLRDIATATNLPKSSALRLLGQLAEAGYAEQLSRAAGWRATSRVLALSSGFRLSDLVTEAAIAPMRAFTARYQWPIFLGVPEEAEMIVRYGTVAESPLAVDALIHNAPTPFLLSALGQAYLAFCPVAEREAIIAKLARSPRRSDRRALDRTDLDHVLETIITRGYAITDEATRHIVKNVPRRAAEGRKRATGLAVPIHADNHVLGALSLRYFRSTLTDTEAARQFLAPMHALAKEIAEANRKPQDKLAGNKKA